MSDAAKSLVPGRRYGWSWRWDFQCGHEWRPKCRCGSRQWRHESQEVERDAA